MGGNNEFFENFERNKYLKKLPSMQRVKTSNKLVQHVISDFASFINKFLVVRNTILCQSLKDWSAGEMIYSIVLARAQL